MRRGDMKVSTESSGPLFAEFLDRHRPAGADRARRVAALYHAVRRIPYGSTGERDPAQVIARNLGSCSGKHILLRDLLRASGFTADVVTIFTHFSRTVPAHPAMPEPLREMLSGEPVVDFHQYVKLSEGPHRQVLDATWHDWLRSFGFPVNDTWDGTGNTVLAATPIHEYHGEEDIAAHKVQLLEGLGVEQRERREAFFRLLTEWIAAGDQTSVRADS